MLAIISATSSACLVLSGLASLYLEVTSILARMYLYLFPYRYPKAYTANRTDAFHLELLPGDEVYRCVLGEGNALAKVLVLITIV